MKVITGFGLVATIALVVAVRDVWSRSAAPVPHGGDRPQRLYNGDEPLHACHGKVPFPRQRITGECEGYWRSFAEEARERKFNRELAPGEPVLPWPQPGLAPFCGAEQWSKRLHFLEALAGEAKGAAFGLSVKNFRGLSPSRLDDGVLLGSREFHSTLPRSETGVTGEGSGTVCWPAEYREHYVGRHRVVPSEEFYRFVVAKYDAISAARDADDTGA